MVGAPNSALNKNHSKGLSSLQKQLDQCLRVIHFLHAKQKELIESDKYG